MPIDRQELRHRLFQLVGSQSGYFTAAQARSIGYSYQAQKHHADRHNWVRVDRGLFRVPEWPVSGFDELVRWSLWSRGLGIVSHEKALAAHELGELDPRKMHLTAPKSFTSRDPGVVLHCGELGELDPRKMHLTVPKGFASRDLGVVLHHGELAGADIETRDGFQITTPLRSIIDVAAGAVDADQLSRAMDDALKRGLFTARGLRTRAEAVDPKAALRIERALQELERA